MLAVVARSRSAPEEACERDVGCWLDADPLGPVAGVCCFRFFESACSAALASVPGSGVSRVDVETKGIS